MDADMNRTAGMAHGSRRQAAGVHHGSGGRTVRMRHRTGGRTVRHHGGPAGRRTVRRGAMRRRAVMGVLMLLRESQSRQGERQHRGNGKGSQHGNPHRCFGAADGHGDFPAGYHFAATM
jgi:hypothetical protein